MVPTVNEIKLTGYILRVVFRIYQICVAMKRTSVDHLAANLGNQELGSQSPCLLSVRSASIQ